MYLFHKLYVDESCEDDKNKILRNIRRNKGQLDVYLIALAGGRDNFDVIHVANLKQKGYPKDDLYIMGMAKGKDDALQIATDIYMEYYNQYQNTAVKEEILKNKDTLFRRF